MRSPRRKVALLVTCLVDQIRPEVGIATVRLLRRLGCDVSFPAAQTCCGQPLWNAGFAPEARRVARGILDAFEGAEWVVAPSGSCAGMVRHAYPQLFADDPLQGPRARSLAERTRELSQFVVEVLGVEDVGARFPHRATYHPSCHASRLCGVRTEPERLLARVAGLELASLARAEDCCGFGGAFAVKQADVSAAIAREKCAHVRATGATHVVSTDVGCLLNLEGVLRAQGSDVQAVHLAQVLETRA